MHSCILRDSGDDRSDPDGLGRLCILLQLGRLDSDPPCQSDHPLDGRASECDEWAGHCTRACTVTSPSPPSGVLRVECPECSLVVRTDSTSYFSFRPEAGADHSSLRHLLFLLFSPCFR